MTMLHPGGHVAASARGSAPPTRLERILAATSAATMLMTLPQVFTIWVHRDAHGVSLASWLTYLVAACLWLVHGIQKRDRTIWIACVGWILLDAAIVTGILFHG